MSSQLKYHQLSKCGLLILIVFCVFSDCKVIDNANPNTNRFLDLFSGMQALSDKYCNSACGPSRFLFSLQLQQKFCQMKCPNSTIANLQLGNGQNTTTTQKPESTPSKSTTLPQSTASTSNGNSASSSASNANGNGASNSTNNANGAASSGANGNGEEENENDDSETIENNNGTASPNKMK